MAEAILRYLTRDRLFIVSGGVHFGSGVIHPMVQDVMKAMGVPILGQTVHTLESARRQRHTYDVMVSIIEKPKHQQQQQQPSSSLFPSTPSHWSLTLNATDARQRFDLWSPADPMIMHENSTRKFQDSIYEGEPLFMRLETNTMKKDMQLVEDWVVPDVSTTLPAERVTAHRQRFEVARDELVRRSVKLVHRLEEVYGEQLLLQPIASSDGSRRVPPQDPIQQHQ